MGFRGYHLLWSPATQNLGPHPEDLGRAPLGSNTLYLQVSPPLGARTQAWKRRTLWSLNTQERLQLCEARRPGCPSKYLLGSINLPQGRLLGHMGLYGSGGQIPGREPGDHTKLRRQPLPNPYPKLGFPSLCSAKRWRGELTGTR